MIDLLWFDQTYLYLIIIVIFWSLDIQKLVFWGNSVNFSYWFYLKLKFNMVKIVLFWISLDHLFWFLISHLVVWVILTKIQWLYTHNELHINKIHIVPCCMELVEIWIAELEIWLPFFYYIACFDIHTFYSYLSSRKETTHIASIQ